jgi:Conjugal transfer protein TraD
MTRLSRGSFRQWRRDFGVTGKNRLRRLRPLLIRLENQLGRIRMETRKQDTRNKIQLGGLVIKAGLAEEDTAVILGALALAAEALNGAENELIRRRFRRVGDRVFSEDQRETA